MRLITRNDASLGVALVAAAVIMFRQPLRDILDLVQAIEARFRLDFLPALLLLVVVFSFHQYRKHLQSRAEVKAAAGEARQAQRQTQTLQQLITLSQALGTVLDRTSLQQALWKHLPLVVGERRFWVLTRQREGWDAVVHDTANDPRPHEALEQIANRALGGEQAAAPAADDSDACFPLLVGGAIIGVIGVRKSPPLAPEQQSAIAAAAASVAIAFKNMQLFADTREMSVRDGLTGCFNRSYAIDALDTELRRSRRTGALLSVLMFDVDHFKGINDRFGHLAGDELLRGVGEQLEKMLRRTDIRCRYGGDEFLLILPETPSLGAQQVAESLRQALGALRITVQGPAPAISVSIGVATSVEGDNPEELIGRADAALYQAKRGGRNRAIVAARAAQGGIEHRGLTLVGQAPLQRAGTA